MELKLKHFIFCVLSAGFVFCDNSLDVTINPNIVDVKSTTTSVTEDTDYSSSTAISNQDYKKLTKKRCAREYNVNCLKVDLISSVEKLGRNTDFQLLPGVKVIGNTDLFLSQRNGDTKMFFSADNISQQLDELLVRRLISYAKSLSLNIQIFDKDQKKGKSFGSSMLENLIWAHYPTDSRAEKKTGKWGSTLLMAGLLTGGTLLWMGLSSLMAMATKALAASLLSIVISCITAYRSSGASHKSTTYEIVAKPVYSHAYTAELQHDPHSAATSHQYGRNMEWDKMASMSSRSEIQVPIREDAHQLAYRAHVRPILKRNAI